MSEQIAGVVHLGGIEHLDEDIALELARLRLLDHDLHKVFDELLPILLPRFIIKLLYEALKAGF